MAVKAEVSRWHALCPAPFQGAICFLDRLRWLRAKRFATGYFPWLLRSLSGAKPQTTGKMPVSHWVLETGTGWRSDSCGSTGGVVGQGIIDLRKRQVSKFPDDLLRGKALAQDIVHHRANRKLGAGDDGASSTESGPG
jgi:hypothetical protein